MHRVIRTALFTSLPCLALSLSGCDNPFSKETVEHSQVTVVSNTTPTAFDSSALLDELEKEMAAESTMSAVYGASEIPYPVYPNGQKYRVGGENGLKIVVFQTDDDFSEVDAYYSEFKENAGMSRLLAMQDYVRYSSADTDADPWATDKPGIVIHQFNDELERRAVGASSTAQTNIIMSF